MTHRLLDLTVAPGSVRVIVSGLSTSYEGKAGKRITIVCDSRSSVTASTPSEPRTMLFQPPVLLAVATRLLRRLSVTHVVPSTHARPISSCHSSPVEREEVGCALMGWEGACLPVEKEEVAMPCLGDGPFDLRA